MNKLKFRAWSVKTKMMHILDPYNRDDYPKGTIYDLAETDYWKVMQFTGLLDKNGKEIFSGDVVRILYTDWPSNTNQNISWDEYKKSISRYGEVIFSNDFGFAEFSLINESLEWTGRIAPGRHGEIEVIGNIWEHPELVNKED